MTIQLIEWQLSESTPIVVVIHKSIDKVRKFTPDSEHPEQGKFRLQLF